MRIFFILVREYGDLLNQDYYPIICRSISAAFLISNAIRKNVSMHIYFLREKTCLCFLSSRLRHIRPDEASTLGILKKAYYRMLFSKNFRLKNVHSGVYLRKIDLKSHLKKYGDTIYVNERRGRDITQITFLENPIFVFPLINTCEKNIWIEDLKIKRVSISRYICSIDQLIVLVNNELDRRKYHDY